MVPGELRQFNWEGVSITPTTAAQVAITGVTSFDIDPQGSAQKFSGDGDRYPTTVVSDFVDNLITIVAADLQAIRTLVPGTYGALAALHKDARKATASATSGHIGDIAYAVADPNLMVVNNPTGGQHRQYGQGRLICCAESTDGTTNPLSSTVTAA